MKLNAKKYPKHSVEQLTEIGKHYFDKPEVLAMIATEDNQWFAHNTDGMAYANAHVSRKGLQVFVITRAMAEGKVEEPTPEPKKDPVLTEDEIKAAAELEVKRNALLGELKTLGETPRANTGIDKLEKLLEITKVKKVLTDANIKFAAKAKIKDLKKLLTPELKEKLKPAEKKEIDQESIDYNTAVEANTLEGWTAFIEKYPKGKHFDKANKQFEIHFNKPE